MNEVVVVIPTFNERDNLERLASMLLELPLSLGILVVDDNSPDGTGALADQLSQNHPTRISAIHRPAKLGLGTAYLEGFASGFVQETSFVIQMDADFSHHPRYIPEMVQAARERYDLVLGSRYVPGGATPDFPLRRRLLSWGANLFARQMLGLRAHDSTTGFRCYRRQLLQQLPLDSVFSSGYSFLIEMLFLTQRAGFRIGEIPIVFHDRQHGVSKISRQEILRAFYTVLRLAARRVGASRSQPS